MWEKIKSWLGLANLDKDSKPTLEDMEIAKAVAEVQYKQANEVINEAVVIEPVVKAKRGRKPK